MTASLRAKRELREEIDEILRGALTCPVCQGTLVQDVINLHRFICTNQPCIYIDFIISAPLLDEQTGESPLPDERPTDTSWRYMPATKLKRKPPTSYGTQGGADPPAVKALLFVALVAAVVMGFSVPLANTLIERRRVKIGAICNPYAETIIIDVPKRCIEYFISYPSVEEEIR